jgi:hypothetical protein
MKYIKLYEEINFDDIDDVEYNENCYNDFGNHTDFQKFLEENRVLDKFISGFKNVNEKWKSTIWDNYNNYKMNNINYCLVDYLDNTDESDYVLNAFEWGNDRDIEWTSINSNWLSHVFNIRTI